MSVEATGLTVTLGGRRVLDAVDLRAEAGEVTAIVGPNGSGKTTLLRALTGDVPAHGRVTLNGQDPRRLPPARLATLRGVLSQSTHLAFPFTALEVVRLGQQAGIDAGDPRAAARALDRVGLLPKATRRMQDLSGGEQQRVHLARVLAQIGAPRRDGQPCWLFLDEPVAALDIGQQLSVMEIARDFAAGGGGVIAVMHDLNLSAMVARQIVLMREGRLIARGTPAEVLTDATLSLAYGCALRVNTAPAGPFVLPQAARLLPA